MPGLLNFAEEKPRSVSRNQRAAEAVVDADLDGLDRKVLIESERSSDSIDNRVVQRVAEAEVQVFNLRAPIRDEAVLEAGTDHVAVVIAVRSPAREGARHRAELGSIVENGPTALHIKEGAIESEAETGRDIPVRPTSKAHACSGNGGRQRCGAANVHPAAIGFNAKDVLARLPIVSDLAASQETSGVDGCNGPGQSGLSIGVHIPHICMSPGATTMDADVEAGPIVDRDCNGWRRLGVVTRRHIGRNSGGGEQDSDSSRCQSDFLIQLEGPPSARNWTSKSASNLQRLLFSDRHQAAMPARPDSSCK